MDAFHIDLQQWIPFFSSTAQISGGLVGLVFVALTFNGRLIGADSSPSLRALAQQTFADFLTILMVSLLMLVPQKIALGVSTSVILVGSVGVIGIVRSLFALRGSGEAIGRDRRVVQRLGLSFLGNASLLLAGGFIVLGNHNFNGFWSALFSAVIVLVISGSRSAWLLVTQESR